MTIKRKSIIGIICGSFLICALLTGIMFLLLYKPTMSNTSEYKATVKEVNRVMIARNVTWIIVTNEYGELGIVDYNAILENQYFEKMDSGTEILFRISNTDINKLSKNERVFIRTLKTQDKVLITLESYSKERIKENTIGIVLMTVFVLIFAVMTIINIKRFIKTNKKQNKCRRTM